MSLQCTLKNEVSLQGIGLHSGKPTRITLKPAAANRGVTFIRTDLEGAPEIAAHYKNIVNTKLATTLGRGKATISTVEHVLAAFQGMGVDNGIIEVDGPEVPIIGWRAQESFVRRLLLSGSDLNFKCVRTWLFEEKWSLR